MSEKITVLIVDDHTFLRDLLKKGLAAQAEIEVVGEAADAEEGFTQAREKQPDVILMDVDLPSGNGIELTRRVLQENPSIRVIGLSHHQERDSVLSMFSAGAVGYLPKTVKFEEVVHAIRTVWHEHCHYISPRIAGVVVGDIPQAGATKDVVLSPREESVLRLLADGLSSKEIGFELGISHKTIHAHRRNLMEKLNVTSEAELVKIAIRRGLTSL